MQATEGQSSQTGFSLEARQRPKVLPRKRPIVQEMHGVSATPGIQPKVQVVLRQGHKQFKGKALVDTGSQITSIMPEIVKQAGFRTFKMQHPYRVRNADGSYNATGWEESAQVLLEAQGIKEYHNVAIIKSTGQ